MVMDSTRTYEVILLVLLAPCHSAAREPALEQAASHPMQYYLSLPTKWEPGKSWPVVIALEGGNKNFLRMAQTYAASRGDLPYIIVSPMILSNGGDELRSLPEYHYPAAVWDEVAQSGKCKFDFDGIAAVIDDVHARYGGERQVFITGHSAGAHLVWAMILHHPERLSAAAVTCGNFVGRCVNEETLTSVSAPSDLPIRGFQGALDAAREPLELQFQRARAVASAHGYRNIYQQAIEGEGHQPFAKEVLAYFNSLRRK